MIERFGRCPHCDAVMEAMWFTEHEHKKAYVDGYTTIYKTGRKRLNVDYIYCPECDYQSTVDDTYAMEWK